MEDDNLDRSRCPICQVSKKNHPSLVGAHLAVSYCPSCGIPHFMVNIPSQVECSICYNKWSPERGGGVDLHYNVGSLRSLCIPTPHGVQFFTLREEVQ